MDWKVFWAIYLLGIVLVVAQGAAAWFDGYFSQAQMRSHGVTNGWSFLEHGGMLADVVVTTPLVAYYASKYHLDYTSWWGIGTLVVSIGLWLVLAYMYQQGGTTTPEAHTHSGKTTFAGWMHVVYAIAATWVIMLVFLNRATPPISITDIVVLAGLLTPFFFFGVVKFNERWVFTSAAQWQVAGSIAVVWVLAGVRVLSS